MFLKVSPIKTCLKSLCFVWKLKEERDSKRKRPRGYEKEEKREWKAGKEREKLRGGWEERERWKV